MANMKWLSVIAIVGVPILAHSQKAPVECRGVWSNDVQKFVVTLPTVEKVFDKRPVAIDEIQKFLENEKENAGFFSSRGRDRALTAIVNQGMRSIYFSRLTDYVASLRESDIIQILQILDRHGRSGYVYDKDVSQLLIRIRGSFPTAEVDKLTLSISASKFRIADVQSLNGSTSDSVQTAELHKKKYIDGKFEMEDWKAKEAALEKEKMEKRQSLVTALKDRLKSSSDIVRSTLLDRINYVNIRAASSSPKVKAAISIGYDTRPISRLKNLELMRQLLDSKSLFIFDANSPMAQEVADLAGDRVILVGSSKGTIKNHPVYVIKNDYLRMMVYRDARITIASPDSPTGLGAMLDGAATIVFDPYENWNDPLVQWSKDVSKKSVNLGLSSYSNTFAAKTIEDCIALMNKKSRNGYSEPYRSDDAKTVQSNDPIERMSIVEMQELLAFADETEGDIRALEYDSEGRPRPGGAVVFGSGSNNSRFTKMIWDSVYAIAKQGVPISTGGADGYMKVANDAAYGAGVESIGIPLGRGTRIKTETSIATGVQTMTLGARGYEQRIPYLLHGRKMILFVPGGKGTAKELGVTLMKLGQDLKSDEIVVFVGAEYYKVLFEQLKISALPVEIKRRFVLVDSADEMNAVYKDYLSQVGNKSQLADLNLPVARNNHTSFEGKEYSESSKEDSSWGDVGFSFGDGDFAPEPIRRGFVPKEKINSSELKETKSLKSSVEKETETEIPPDKVEGFSFRKAIKWLKGDDK